MVVLMDISSRCARTSCVSNFGQVVPLCILGYFISWNNPTKVGFYPYPNFLSIEPEDQNDLPAGQTPAFQARASMGRGENRKRVVKGKSKSVCVDVGGGGINKKKNN